MCFEGCNVQIFQGKIKPVWLMLRLVHESQMHAIPSKKPPPHEVLGTMSLLQIVD